MQKPDTWSRILLVLFISFLILYTAESQKDWKMHKSKGEIQLWLKDLPGSRVKQFKIQTKVKQNITAVYQLLREVEKSPLWYDKVKEVKVLKAIDNDEAVYLLEYELPFPFKNRVTTLKGTIVYDQKLQTIRANTVYFPYEIPVEYKDLSQVYLVSGTWAIETLSDGRLSITHIGYMDPEGNIPAWLVNQSYTSGPFKTLTNLLKLLDK
jgi:hypothetical protein